MIGRDERLLILGAVLLAAGIGIGVLATFTLSPTEAASNYSAPQQNTSLSSQTNASGSNTSSAVVSKQEARQQVQNRLDQQVAQQRARLRQLANQSANLTADDVSFSATVSSVTQSQFTGLYKVNISVNGTVPRQFGGGTREISQIQTQYLSKDGQYLFPSPQNLTQARQSSQTPIGG